LPTNCHRPLRLTCASHDSSLRVRLWPCASSSSDADRLSDNTSGDGAVEEGDRAELLLREGSVRERVRGGGVG